MEKDHSHTWHIFKKHAQKQGDIKTSSQKPQSSTASSTSCYVSWTLNILVFSLLPLLTTPYTNDLDRYF